MVAVAETSPYSFDASDVLDELFCCKTRVAVEPVSQCLRRVGCGGDVNNGYVNVKSDEKVKEKRSRKVGVT